MPEGERGRGSIVGAAGRTAVALLRSTGHRAKLGTLHLPISLHPHRPEPLLLPSEARPAEQSAADPASLAPALPMTAESRALRSKLAAAERRNARLRHALQRERLAAARALETVAEPGALVDHLVADLHAVQAGEEEERRRIITSVLAAYGFRTGRREQEVAQPLAETASVPRLNRGRQEELISRMLAAQPDIGSPRYVQLALDGLARHPSLTLPQLIDLTGMTSPVARRRLRLALESLHAAGAVERQGARYRLAL